MKRLLFFGAFALLALVSCKEDNVEPEPGTEYDEAWYAANATISPSDAHFAYTEEGGEISFKAEGGSVVVYVDCGTEWTAENSAADIFGCDVQETCITVTAEQNLVEEELYGTITLMTAESKIHFATISITQNAYGAPEITVAANEWHVPAVAATAEELTTEIGVEATGEWEIESDAEWLTAEKGGDGGDCVILTATENETFEERVAEVVLTCTDGYNSDSETITVTQDALAYITLSDEEFEFDKKGGEATVTVESNYEWSYEYESDWFTVSESTDGSLTITVDVNGTGADREGTVTFTAGDGAANVAETTLSITQSIEDPDALILEYTIPSENTTIQLPIADVTNAEIDWGDDSDAETVTSYWPSHTYSEVGTYTVSISGTVNTIASDVLGDDGVIYAISGAGYLTAVIQWGDLGLTSMEDAFSNCSSLTDLPESSGPFENVTTFSNAFCECTSLKDVPEDLFKNCTKCTTFSYAFRHCTSLKEVPEDLFKNCAKCTSFGYAFNNCTSLTVAPSFEGLSAVTSFFGVFWGCSALTTLPENMFTGCSKADNLGYLFCNCSKLVGESPYEEITVDGDTVKVHLYERANYRDYFTSPGNYKACFMGCTKLDDYGDIPSGWKNY